MGEEIRVAVNCETMDRKSIAFVWQGITERKEMWKDGLWAAMKHIEKDHDVTYHEPWENIPENSMILYWEAPCTENGKNAEHYRRVRQLPNKKALLFAGGPIKEEWLEGFDHIFVESKINCEELCRIGISHSTAFGINEEIFYPLNLNKKYVGIHHGTCASWKRQWLVGEALGSDGLVIGRYQETDPSPFDRCKQKGCTVIEERTAEELNTFINESLVCVQTSDYWGGGQRCTLEAMACNVPVVCMTDSPKNREYVEESGFGTICEPNPGSIKGAVESVANQNYGDRGREYVMSKWTSKHYADNLLEWINQK